MIEMDCLMIAFDQVAHDEKPLPTQPFPLSFRRVEGHG